MEVKQLWCEADHSPESSVEVKKSGALHVLSLDVFMADRGTAILWCAICEFHISVLFIYMAEILTSIHLYVYFFFFLEILQFT